MSLNVWSVPSHPDLKTAPTLPRTVFSVRLTGLAADVAATTMVTAPMTKLYLVLAEMLCTTAAAAGTVTLTVRATDDVGATSGALGPLSLTAPGRASSSGLFACLVGTALSYEATRAGVSGSPIYALYLAVLEL